MIWTTPYIQRAIDAIMAGTIPLADCKGVPENIAAALKRALASLQPPA